MTATTVHFDDADFSFPALQKPTAAGYNLFITEDTYAALQRDGHIDGGEGASDYAPSVDDLRDISDWEVNFED